MPLTYKVWEKAKGNPTFDNRLKIDMNDRTLTGIVLLGRSFVEPIIGDRIIDALTYM